MCRHAFALTGEAYAIDHPVRDLPLADLGIKLLFVRRSASRIEDFDSDFTLASGDILVVAGPQDKIISFENWSLQGEA